MPSPDSLYYWRVIFPHIIVPLVVFYVTYLAE